MESDWWKRLIRDAKIHGSCDNEQVKPAPKAAWYGDWQANAIAITGLWLAHLSL